MSENEFVTVPVKVPEEIMRLLKDRDYFGYGKDLFFTVCVNRGVACELNELDMDEAKALQKEYGLHPSLVVDVTKKLKI